MAQYRMNQNFLIIGIYGEFCRKKNSIIHQYMLNYFPKVTDSSYSLDFTRRIDLMRKSRLYQYPRAKRSEHGNFAMLGDRYLYTCAPTVIDVIPIQVIENYYGMNLSSSIEQAAIDLKEITRCGHTVGYIMRYLYAYFIKFKDGYYFNCITDDGYPTGEIVRVFPCNNIFIDRGYQPLCDITSYAEKLIQENEGTS